MFDRAPERITVWFGGYNIVRRAAAPTEKLSPLSAKKCLLPCEHKVFLLPLLLDIQSVMNTLNGIVPCVTTGQIHLKDYEKEPHYFGCRDGVDGAVPLPDARERCKRHIPCG